MKFCGMVTLYNPRQENIDNIYEYLDELDKVYLIDNSSIDNSKLIKKNKKIMYIPNKENLGIATALNIACKQAIKDKFNWILTMDQDSKITKKVLIELIKYVKENDTTDVSIVSPYHNIDTNRIKSKKKIEECLEVMTSGNLLNLDIYQKIGGFKEWLFIDDVDIEYCLNANKNGYKVLRMNDVIMDHHLGNTKTYKIFNKRFICSNHNATRRYYMVRNMLYVYDLYHDIYPEYCEFLKNVQKGQVRYILMFEKNKFRKLKMMYKGYKDYKKGIKGKLV